MCRWMKGAIDGRVDRCMDWCVDGRMDRWKNRRVNELEDRLVNGCTAIWIMDRLGNG